MSVPYNNIYHQYGSPLKCFLLTFKRKPFMLGARPLLCTACFILEYNRLRYYNIIARNFQGYESCFMSCG